MSFVINRSFKFIYHVFCYKQVKLSIHKLFHALGLCQISLYFAKNIVIFGSEFMNLKILGHKAHFFPE